MSRVRDKAVASLPGREGVRACQEEELQCDGPGPLGGHSEDGHRHQEGQKSVNRAFRMNLHLQICFHPGGTVS